MKAAVQHRHHLAVDDQRTCAAVDCEQLLEVGGTVDGAVATVELLGRQLARTLYTGNTPQTYVGRLE